MSFPLDFLIEVNALSVKPRFSIITVCLNAVSTIEQTLNSVLSQTLPSFEYIVIDGGSTDGTREVIEKHRTRLSHVVFEPDEGIYDAFNKGLALATGDIVGILNADDMYVPWALETVAEAASGNPESEIFYGNQVMLDESRRRWTIYPLEGHRNLLSSMSIPHPATFVRRSLYEKSGFFDDSFKITGDWDLILRFFKTGASFYPINRVLTAFRNSGISFQPSRRLLAENGRIYRANLSPSAAYKALAKMELRYWGRKCLNALKLYELYARYRDRYLLKVEMWGDFDGSAEAIDSLFRKLRACQAEPETKLS